MKLIKEGRVYRNERGGVTIEGYTWDAEGGPINLSKMIEEAEQLIKIKEAKR